MVKCGKFSAGTQVRFSIFMGNVSKTMYLDWKIRREHFVGKIM